MVLGIVERVTIYLDISHCYVGILRVIYFEISSDERVLYL